MVAPAVPIPADRIADFCRRHHIRRLALFGSVLRPRDFDPDSDIDVFVEFEEGVSVGLRFFGMEEELEGIFHRKVDLNTYEFLSPYFRDELLLHDIYVRP